MTASHETLLCSYRYDALDRLLGTTIHGEQSRQRFYCKNRLSTEIHGNICHTIVQHANQLLAQTRRIGNTFDTMLLATNQQRSILQTLQPNQIDHLFYSPYGFSPAKQNQKNLLSFNGERLESITGHYVLGNGYRALNPILMRFNTPDSFSPFGRGGINSYVYVLGDPVNKTDPTGHISFPMDAVVAALIKHKPRLKIPRPSLISTKSTSTVIANSTPDGFTLAGFHGSSSKHTTSLGEGLSINHAGTANGQKHGAGFYATLDIDFAGNYAKTSVDLDYRGHKQALFPYSDFSYDPAIANVSYIADKSPTIFGVYVKDYPNTTPGKNFKFIHGAKNTAAGSEIVFPPAMYPNIRVTPITSLANPPKPWTANLGIRRG